VVLVVDVIADPHKLPFLVGARHEDDRDAQQVVLRQLRGIGGVGLKNKLVDADGDGAHQNFIQYLVLAGVLGAADVKDLPFEVVVEFLQAFKCDFELKGICEARRIVQDGLWEIVIGSMKKLRGGTHGMMQKVVGIGSVSVQWRHRVCSF
jgi:hypothetical protein